MFSLIFDKYKIWKEQHLFETVSRKEHLFETEVFCNNVKVCNVPFDKFYAYLQKKNIHLFQKSCLSFVYLKGIWSLKQHKMYECNCIK